MTAIPEGFRLVPIEPTHAMERAAAESCATDDEGSFGSLVDLLDFSGENAAHTVIRAALRAAISAAPHPVTDADHSFERP